MMERLNTEMNLSPKQPKGTGLKQELTQRKLDLIMKFETL